jgi:hypothetical protein
MLTSIEHIGYTVKFPVSEDQDTSMTLALNRLNITSTRSLKPRMNHFYAPYARSKHRCSSDPSTRVESISHQQGPSVPLRQPWGMLISKTLGKPDISLTGRSTGLGDMCEFVDYRTAERVQQFSEFLMVLN